VGDQEQKSFQQCVIDYELAVREIPPAELMPATLALLDGITAACSQGGFIEKKATRTALEHWYTRAAAALTHYITAPTATLKLNDVHEVTRRKQAVAYVFAASGFRNMSHLIALMKNRDSDVGTMKVDTKRAAVLLTFIGLDDVPDSLMDIAMRQSADLLLPLCLGWLNQRAVLTSQGEKNRGRLLTSGHLLEPASISDREIPYLMNAWMYSTYASEPKKHDIKTWFNQLLLKRLTAVGVVAKPITRTIKKRPKLLVIHERFVQAHAMYRCYAPMMRTLADHFYTVALSDTSLIDEASDEIFDEVIRLPTERPSVKDIVTLIEQQEADVIYYSSLGMSYWTVMVAALRLAPIQIMTHGHPATSMLSTIDFVYLPRMKGDLSLVNSEKVIMGPANVALDAHSELPAELPSLLPPSDREVRIAVNSKVMKLSWRLIAVCKRIEKEAQVPVRFSFFPGERLLYMDGLEAAIRTQLPNAKVLPYVDYEPFLKEICKCDLALAAFPFGNTNSTVDTSLLGLPTVAHFGPESPAQTDALILEMAGLPGWLVCDNDEDYFQTALRLVNDPAERTKAMAGLNRETLRAHLFYSADSEVERDPFGDVLWGVYNHFEALQESAKRQFDYQEILAMDTDAVHTETSDV
jgi:hypothetical protein